MTTKRVVFWGTYDKSKPRVRILLHALKDAGATVEEIHEDIWRSQRDKSQINSLGQQLKFLCRWLAVYPKLIFRYLKAPRHDAVVIGYLGQLDVIVLWPFAKLRGMPIIWDMFISLYDTVVSDRAMVSPRHPLAWGLWAWEWLACRAASIVVIDTLAHARHISGLFGLADTKTDAVYVGAELDQFSWAPDPAQRAEGMPIQVLFYGQFIPLHGIETIVRAAGNAQGLPIQWTLVGQGQEDERIRTLIAELEIGQSLELIPWIPYEELSSRIADADVCLGIFGVSDKAANVIPNKVFQILAVGSPLVTRDSPAIRELLDDATPGIKLIPPGDPEALVEAILSLRAEGLPRFPKGLRDRTSSTAIGSSLLGVIEKAKMKPEK